VTSVATIRPGPDAYRQALAADADWIWFLAAGGRPRGDALEHLLTATRAEDGASPAILAGLLVDERGVALDDSLQPAPRIDPREAVRLVRRRLLPLRSAGFGHCLVERAAFSRHGVPNDSRFGAFAAQEWTARVLRGEPGYLVAESVVVLAGGASGMERASVRAAVRMLPTGTWTRGEAARVLAASVMRRRR